MKILTTAPPGSPEWLQSHEGKLGAHQILSILGIGRSTPLQTWAELTGKIERPDISRKSYVRRGVALEEAVARLYSEESGRTVSPSPGLVQHPAHDWIALTPDRTVAFPHGPGLLEAKTAGFGRSREWAAGPPLAVVVQLQMQLAVCEMPVGSAACIPVDADEDAEPVLWQDLAADAMLVERILTALSEWREHYWLKDVPPPATAEDTGTARAMFPREVVGSVMTMTPEMEEMWTARRCILLDIKDRQAQADEIEARLKLAIGENEWAQGSGYVLRWREQIRKGYTVQESKSRPLIQMKEIK